MKFDPPHCPNQECTSWGAGEGNFYIKRGYYRTRSNNLRIPRYQCKHCGCYFSSNSFRDTAGQHRPGLNERLYKLLGC